MNSCPYPLHLKSHTQRGYNRHWTHHVHASGNRSRTSALILHWSKDIPTYTMFFVKSTLLHMVNEHPKIGVTNIPCGFYASENFIGQTEGNADLS